MVRAMILAAGRGERMRPLSDVRPKALLEVAGCSLIEWQVRRLVAAGISELVINHAWLGRAIEDQLGDGSRWGATIRYSPEDEALETAGGIARALPLLGDEPFIAVSADIYTEYDYRELEAHALRIRHDYPARRGHLVLTDNPSYHPAGDMGLDGAAITLGGPKKLTYANIAVFHPHLFDGIEAGRKLKLFPWLYQFLGDLRITGERFSGRWENLGTPDQLADLNRRLSDGGAAERAPA